MNKTTGKGQVKWEIPWWNFGRVFPLIYKTHFEKFPKPKILRIKSIHAKERVDILKNHSRQWKDRPESSVGWTGMTVFSSYSSNIEKQQNRKIGHSSNYNLILTTIKN